jgi:predicted RNase H-related nuclease YkuK (DUF458 family)
MAFIPEHFLTKEFLSPTFGRLSLEEVFSMVVEYVEEGAGHSYNLIIGTDSFLGHETVFVTALIIHRVGHGGRYFYRKERRRKMGSMRQRIIYEATMSIELASVIREKLSENGFKRLPVEIHLDVGENGDTRDIIKELVGMVRGSGYEAVTKPDSYGASKVADRHSK